MKQHILIAITFGSLLSAPSFGASSPRDEFTVSGASDVVSAPSEAERAMKEKAQAYCGFGAVAIQRTATEFALYPRAFPTTRVATATFVCMKETADVQSTIFPSSKAYLVCGLIKNGFSRENSSIDYEQLHSPQLSIYDSSNPNKMHFENEDVDVSLTIGRDNGKDFVLWVHVLDKNTRRVNAIVTDGAAKIPNHENLFVACHAEG